jgi:hypothetical protein
VNEELAFAVIRSIVNLVEYKTNTPYHTHVAIGKQHEEASQLLVLAGLDRFNKP